MYCNLCSSFCVSTSPRETKKILLAQHYEHWNAQNPVNCMSGLHQYIPISCHSFSLPITPKSAVPSHKSPNSRSWQGWDLRDRLLSSRSEQCCTRRYEQWLWPVACSHVTVHHPTDKWNSFEWRQCLKTAGSLIWRLNYYNALWKICFSMTSRKNCSTSSLLGLTISIS